jgi:hypothetical protein
MSKRCTLCKCNPNKYWNLFNREVKDTYKSFYYCKHDVLRYKLGDFCKHDIPILDKNICTICTINNIRHKNKLDKIDDKDLGSMTCVKWKIGESTELYCWKNSVPMCDVLNCDYPAMEKYIKLENFVNNAKNNFYLTMDSLSTNIPIEIFNIIINYAYIIHPTNNGLCISHNIRYNESVRYIFDCIPECKICIDRLQYNKILRDKLRQYNNYFYGNDILYHKSSSNKCNKILRIDDDPYKYTYTFGGCIELCKQLGTWCEICNQCIGHPDIASDINTHNISKYPHCNLCGKHSQYLHCNLCGIHSKYQHCEICGKHSQYQHYYCCNDHFEYPHCENCWNLGYEFVHHRVKEICNRIDRVDWL